MFGKRYFIRETLLGMLFSLIQIGFVGAQTSSFTYQGRFTDAGTPANGTYDMQFKLFDGVGNQIGSTVSNGAVIVTSGVFTVQLDYGAAAFSGADRLLEIGVRTAGSGEAYTILSPRQPLTSSPYAIRAGATTTADNAAQLGGVAASQYVQSSDTRLSDARTPSAGSANYIQNTNSPQAANFNISGNGNAGGTLSANVVNTATQYNLNGIRFLSGANVNQSVYVGPNAGPANPTNGFNTYVGANAGRSTTSGSGNSFFGTSAGYSNDSGDSNSFFGHAAGLNNKGGQQNSFFGRETGYDNSTGASNSFFGAFSGGANTEGNANSFFGMNSGRANLTGSENSYFGFNAGYNNAKGTQNSMFGAEAGQANTADNNSFFGYQSGFNNVSGMDNSYFGQGAGLLNKSGFDNTFVGSRAGEANLASENSFFGSASGVGNTTGTRNSFFGKDSGVINETTSDNSLFGYHSGYFSRGGSNSFFGSQSGAKNSAGFANAFFGFESGDGNTGGFNNSFFGRGAGKANIDGNSNTVLGAFAEFDSGNLSFATAIGSGAHVGTSNTVVLGRNSDQVQVPGTLVVNTLGVAGSTSLCRNIVNQISSCSSSLRYKKDLHPFTRGLALLNQLKPITFKWKADSSPDLGFGAEDIAAVEPLLITRNDKGEVEGVKYDRITAVLVNAVKEQQEQIKQQRDEIASLKKLVCRRHRKANVCK